MSCWAISPDDSHIAIVQLARFQASLSILNTRDGHGKQQFMLQRHQLGKRVIPSHPHELTWSRSGSHISVTFWPEGRRVIQLSGHAS